MAGLDRLGHVELQCRSVAWSSPPSWPAVPVRGRPHLRRLPGLDQPAHGPLPRRGRGRVRAPLTRPEDHPRARPHPSTGRADPAAAQRARPRPASTPAPTPSTGTCTTTTRSAVPGHHQPDPDPRRAGDPRAVEATQVVLHPLRSRPAQRDLAVRLHPLPAHPPRRPPGTDVEIITWLDDHSRYALHVTAHPRITAPIVLATFRASRRPARTSRLHPDRQRHGLHRPVRRHGRQGGRNHARARTPPLGHHPEELPPQPPHHLRQGRTLPANPQEVAPRPTPPAQHHRRAPNPDRRVHRRVQPPPTPPLPAAPGHPGHRLPRPAQGHPRHRPRPATPTTASATTRSSKAGTVTLRVAGQLRHIGIGRTYAGTHVILLVQDLARPRRQRRHRRTPPRTHHRPPPRLPAHRPTTRTHPKNE